MKDTALADCSAWLDPFNL